MTGVLLEPHLKDLLTRHLDAAVAGLRLLLRQFLAENLELLNKVSLVLGHREALCLFRELTGGHQSLLDLLLQLVLATAGQGDGERQRRGAQERERERRVRKRPRRRDGETWRNETT